MRKLDLITRNTGGWLMPVLTNPRHEKFAQLVAQGKCTLEEAYEYCGYKPNRHNASKLANQQHVKDRVIQITTEMAKRTAITKEKLIEMNMNIHEAEFKSGQYPAAVSAGKEVGIYTGHRIERSEVGAPGDFDHLNDGELERLLRCARLLGRGLAGERHAALIEALWITKLTWVACSCDPKAPAAPRYATGNGRKPTSLPPQPGCWIVAPLLPQEVQRARCLNRLLDASAPQQMTATAQASGA
jgi:hypothetical protein